MHHAVVGQLIPLILLQPLFKLMWSHCLSTLQLPVVQGWCAMSNAGHLKSLLISSGLMLRLHAPAQAMKGIEAAIEQLLMVTGRAAAEPVAPGSVVGLPVHDAAAGAAAWKGALQQQQQLATDRKLLQAADPAAVAAAAEQENTACQAAVVCV
jgi:hypothetical protein